MPKENAYKRAAKRGTGKARTSSAKDKPETACIVCGSEDWCDCEWDHVYGESMDAAPEEGTTEEEDEEA
jgi:hypothetical protein